jgi:hypothetical protein
LGEQLAAGPAEPVNAAVQQVDRPDTVDGGVLPRHPDREVDESVAVEVAGGKRVPEAVAGLGDAGHLGAGLGEQLAAGTGQPSSRPVQHVDRPASPMAPTSSEKTPTARSAKPLLSKSARTLAAVTEDAVWTASARPGTADQAVAASVRTRATALRGISATSCGAERQHTLLD